jgi:hypothetical protein
MAVVDGAAPAWLLDVAQDTIRSMFDQLSKAMFDHGEDSADNDLLWRHRQSQLWSIMSRELDRSRPADWTTARRPWPYDGAEGRARLTGSLGESTATVTNRQTEGS